VEAKRIVGGKKDRNLNVLVPKNVLKTIKGRPKRKKEPRLVGLAERGKISKKKTEEKKKVRGGGCVIQQFHLCQLTKGRTSRGEFNTLGGEMDRFNKEYYLRPLRGHKSTGVRRKGRSVVGWRMKK